MKKYNVTGMSCAACSSRVEKAVSAVDGVQSCTVNLLTNSMMVEGTAAPDAIIKAVTDAGYGASEAGKKSSSSDDGTKEIRAAESALRTRLIVSAIFLVVLMYFSMGHTMWNFPLPSALAENHVAMALIQLLLTTAVMVVNQKFFISGVRGLIHRSPNMDTLVSLGAGAAYVYSLWAMFEMTFAAAAGDHASAVHYMHELYFESAAMILTLITVGKELEAHSKGKTTDALRSLMDLAPKTAVLVDESGAEREVPIEDVSVGDIFVVRSGASVPVDGVILDGSAAIDESALTGESVPVEKGEGDRVSAATVSMTGYIRCRATGVGEDTALAQIIRMVSDASATKAPIAKVADKVSGVFVPVVIAIAAVTIAAWLIAGESVGYALARGISVLVISCPCALGLATPVAIMVGNGVGARHGILFKTAEILEAAGKVKNIALDKTGTITEGVPEVTDVVPIGNNSADELLRTALSLEARSEHPLAGAVMREGERLGAVVPEIEDFKVAPGGGVSGVLDGEAVFGGNARYLTEVGCDVSPAAQSAKELADSGKTPLMFAKDRQIIGIIATADRIRPDSAEAIGELKDMGIHVVMLTGDNKNTAALIGRESGVDEIIADVLPDAKEAVVAELSKKGSTAMVGDGINDSPALTRADVGIAVGAGTDIAIDSADIVLMNSSLADVPAAVRLSRATLRNIHENLFWAFIYNVIGIPFAAGVFVPLLGWELNPMFAAAAMSLSSFCVVTNALRLNFVKLKKNNNTKTPSGGKSALGNTEIRSKGENETMKKTLNVEGMMCAHCEGRVKAALEAIDGVESAVADHNSATAVVTLSHDVADDVLVAAVTEQGYKAKIA